MKILPELKLLQLKPPVTNSKIIVARTDQRFYHCTCHVQRIPCKCGNAKRGAERIHRNVAWFQVECPKTWTKEKATDRCQDRCDRLWKEITQNRIWFPWHADNDIARSIASIVVQLDPNSRHSNRHSPKSFSSLSPILCLWPSIFFRLGFSLGSRTSRFVISHDPRSQPSNSTL